jgi:hypothetical protein
MIFGFEEEVQQENNNEHGKAIHRIPATVDSFVVGDCL